MPPRHEPHAPNISNWHENWGLRSRTELTEEVAGSAGITELPEHIWQRINELRGTSLADNTKRSYATMWRHFVQWCANHGLSSAPATAQTVAHYIVDRSETLRPDGRWLYSPDTVELWVQAIDKLHWLAGHPRPGRDPYVKQVLDGIRREKPRRRKQARPVTADILNRVLDSINLTDPIFGMIGNRDYAMFLFGFAGAFRQSELTGLRLMDCTVSEDNVLHAYVRRSKTDQLGMGLTKALPKGIDPRTCCLCGYVRWMTLLETAINHPGWTRRVLAETCITSHICAEAKAMVYDLPEELPLFPQLRRGGTVTGRFANPNAVTEAVHRRAESIGLDPAQYSGHSLRAGFVTQAYRSGATTHEIMRQTGHRSPSSVEDYSRETDPMLHNAASKLGL